MAADKRKQNKKAQKKESEKETLAQHEADLALEKPDETGTDTDTAASSSKKGLTFLGKLGVFLGFPFLVGMGGLYFAYLETVKQNDRELSFDQDFVVPFLLALAMVSVIGFQTGGYTNSEVTPLVPWPKVKRVKKIIYKNKKGEIVPGPGAKSAAAKKDE